MSGPAAEALAVSLAPALTGERVAVVVAVSEEPDDLEELYREYAPVLKELGSPFEFVFALAPRWHAHAAALVAVTDRGEPVRIVPVDQAVGEAALVRHVLTTSDATIVVSLPPYRRVMPEALAAMIAQVAAGSDLVMARRYPRVDSLINQLQSRILHLFIGTVLGSGANDIRCGVRAMRPQLMEEAVVYGDFFRYLPIVAARQGFVVAEVNAPQHPRDVRARLYSPATYLRRLLDVLALFVLLHFAEKPLRFFGSVGFLSALTGGALLAIMFFQRLGGEPLASRPLLLLAGILVVVGVEAIALGLIGELIVYLNARSAGGTRPYRVMRDGE